MEREQNDGSRRSDSVPSAATEVAAAVLQGHHRTPAPRLVRRLYAASNEVLRAQLLTCLLRPLGVLGAAGAAAGAFSVFALRTGADPLMVRADEVTQVSTEQVLELARFVEQVDPQVLVQVADLVSSQAMGMAAFSAATMVLLYRALGRRRQQRSGA